MSGKQKLVIIVINYGTIDLIKELVKNFLSSLPRFPKIRIDWVITDAIRDDRETDMGDEEWYRMMRDEIKNKKGNFFHFFRIQNRGFAGNVNASFILFKKKLGSDYQNNDSDLILLLNPDTSLYWVNLEKAVMFMKKNPKTAIAGMALINPKGQLEKWGHSLKYPTIKYIGRKRFSEPTLSDQPTTVAWVSGGAMLIHYNWWLKLKGLDPAFFFYFEDVDICHRASDKNGEIIFLPQAVVGHRRGGSDISIFRRKRLYYASEARYFHIYRSPSEYLLLRLVRIPFKLFYFARCYLVPSFWITLFKSSKESVSQERSEGFPTFKAFVKSFLSVPQMKGIWIAAIAVNLFILGEAVWGRLYLSSPLILHYNAYLGIDYYGDTKSLFIFALLAFLLSLFNFCLGIVLYISKRYFPFVIIPAGASLAFQLTISVALLNLLVVNS